MKKGELTTEEKIKLLIGKDLWSNDSCNGKIYSFNMSDGPAGLRHYVNTKNGSEVKPSLCYPFGQSLANTWNIRLARKIGNAIANDCIENSVDIILAPGVNIKRLPICGRNFEYFSEDPLLSGEMGREYILGVEEKHVGTSLKHFCCNNVEYSRVWISSEVDERTLREIYLLPFEIACKAKPMTVMSSYNLVNGVKMCAHKKLFNILRNEFNFDGAIISDWWAVKDRLSALKAGLDLQMPWEEKYYNDLVKAYKDKTLPMDMVEECSSRVVELSKKCEKNKKLQKVDMTIKEREAVALETAEESIVLLKNENVLPLNKKEKVMVTGGPLRFRYFGGGSSGVTPRGEYINLQKTLQEYIKDVEYKETITCPRGHSADMGNIKEAVAFARNVDVSIVCVGDNNTCESESFDRQHIKLSREEEDAILKVANVSKKTIVVIYAGSAIDMTAWIDKVDAVIWAGYGGEYINEALAEIIVGKINPSGKLSETFPLQLEDVPAMNSYRDDHCLVYEEGLNVGYRYFNTFKKEVLFPFGYGLSYSKFEYFNLKIKGSGCDYEVSFTIKNKSNVDGKEVAQLYVKELNKNVYRPEKELKGFEKVFVPANGKAEVKIKLNKRAFAYYSTAIDDWKVDAGSFEIQICSNVEKIELSKAIEVKE